MSEAIDTAPPMAKPILKPAARSTAPKQKRGQLPINSTNKQAKKN